MKISTVAGIIAVVTAALSTGCTHSQEGDGVAGQAPEIVQGRGEGAADHVVTDPIHGLLYGTYTSSKGQIASLKLRVSEPVVFSRVDRVDPNCTGDACKTRELTGVWDLAHYEGSLTQVIRFYGPDFEKIDEFAYQRDGDRLTMTYDGRGQVLEWKEPLRAPVGGACVAADKSRVCAENLACTDGICTAK